LQKFLSRLFFRLMKSWSWVLLIVSAIAIKWISLYPEWIEKNYTYGIYPVIAGFQRILFGWIPFSIGDLMYAFLILVIVFRTGKFFKLLLKKQLSRKYFISALQQFIFFFLFLYVFFNLLWGLNYNRTGIAAQLDLKVEKYNLTELDTLTSVFQQRLNEYALRLSDEEKAVFKKKRSLFEESYKAYKEAALQHPFLKYKPKSIKPSIFSYAGNYLGFQGYNNPFSGEGQVNTTIPPVLEPFVTLHEIAHQVGYAREDEANFVAFLSSKASSSDYFRYSLYFNLYLYAAGELFKKDSLRARDINRELHPKVVGDIDYVRAFHRKHRNPIEPLIMWVYEQYLIANNQPMGKETYNEVVALLIAYFKKYGIDAL
jgi:hypothetical protein